MASTRMIDGSDNDAGKAVNDGDVKSTYPIGNRGGAECRVNSIKAHGHQEVQEPFP